MNKSRRQLEQINQLSEAESRCIELLPAHKGPKFEERYKRITIYLENEVFAEVQAIRSQGINQTTLINAAVKEFVQKHWTEQCGHA